MRRGKSDTTHFLMSLYGLYEEMRDEGWYVPKFNPPARPAWGHRAAPSLENFEKAQGRQGVLVEG